MKSVLITVPNQGWVHRSVVDSVQGVILTDQSCNKTVLYPALAPPYYNCLNQLAKAFREGQWDYWLNIDDDNAPTRNPLELMALDKDFIGLPTPMWSKAEIPPLQWNVYMKIGESFKPVTGSPSGLHGVDLVGSGCFLAARRMFQSPGLVNPFFPCYTNEGIRTTGPDTAFCMRATNAGFSLWAHFDYRCKHMKEIDLLDLMEKPKAVSA